MTPELREERHAQLRRIDAWLEAFHRECPILFSLMCVGIAFVISGFALGLLELFSK